VDDVIFLPAFSGLLSLYRYLSFFIRPAVKKKQQADKSLSLPENKQHR